MSPTNSILDKAEPLKLNREIIGPESIASRGDDLFTGLIYGDIIKINKDGKVTTVAKTGKECRKSMSNRNFNKDFVDISLSFGTCRRSSLGYKMWTTFRNEISSRQVGRC